MKRNVKLKITGILALLGFMLVCHDPSLGVYNYKPILEDYTLNIIGLMFLSIVSYICYKDYEKYGMSDEK